MTGQKQILIVEDSIDLRNLIANLLEGEGYATAKAANGREALDVLHAQKAPPDLILLDLMMPVMDGVEFRREQLSVPEFAAIPVVVMTADSNAEFRLGPLKAEGLLHKPVSALDLLDTMERMTRRSVEQ